MLGFTEFQIVDLLCKIMGFDKRGDIRPSDNIVRPTLYMNNDDVTVQEGRQIKTIFSRQNVAQSSMAEDICLQFA